MPDKNRNNSDLLSHAFLFLKGKEKYKYMHICIELLKHNCFKALINALGLFFYSRDILTLFLT